jgi:hypothetical protein
MTQICIRLRTSIGDWNISVGIDTNFLDISLDDHPGAAAAIAHNPQKAF